MLVKQANKNRVQGYQGSRGRFYRAREESSFPNALVSGVVSPGSQGATFVEYGVQVVQ